MGNAALLINNVALSGFATASSEVTNLPASNLLIPHISQKWRSSSNSASVVLDKANSDPADTFVVSGITASTTVRMRLSTTDATGATGNIADQTFADNSANYDSDYGTAVLLLPAPVAWRYARFDLNNPSGTFVEAGLITLGTREQLTHNFASGSSVQYVDRSRITETSAGLKLIWNQNHFRRVELNFDWVTLQQRYGLMETLDLVAGRHSNVLVILDTDSTNLGRDSIVGLISDISPNTYLAAIDLFGKQFRLEERI
jgi:hypothetical protein